MKTEDDYTIIVVECVFSGECSIDSIVEYFSDRRTRYDFFCLYPGGADRTRRMVFSADIPTPPSGDFGDSTFGEQEIKSLRGMFGKGFKSYRMEPVYRRFIRGDDKPPSKSAASVAHVGLDCGVQ